LALRGVLTHRKTRRLARELNISQSFALGVLEALWHVTAEHQLDGGVGRMSDRDIADEMFYEGDPQELIRALVDSGWLEMVPECRLYVHDWHEHADEQVQGKLVRWTKLFARGAPPRIRRLPQKARETVVERYRARFGDLVAERMRRNVDDPDDPSDGCRVAQVAQVAQEIEKSVILAQESVKTPVLAQELIDTPILARIQSQYPEPEPDERTHTGFEIPKKPLAIGPQIVRSSPKARSDLPVADMAAELQRFMSCDGERRVQPPDEAIVLRCIEAAHGVPMIEIAQYLAGLYKAEQSPRHANGPKSYAWFPAVIAARFGQVSLTGSG